MTIGEYIIILLIFVEVCISLYPYIKTAMKPDHRCEMEGCHKVARLYKTKDKRYWMCHKCMKLYNKELQTQ